MRLIDFSEEDIRQRSRLDSGFERVEINRKHPDYLNVMSDNSRREEYYNERLCDETASFVFDQLVQQDRMSPLDAAIFSRKLREESYYNGLKRIKRKR